jgi:hypothetical protein
VPKYRVTGSETVTWVTTMEADSAEQAEEQACCMEFDEMDTWSTDPLGREVTATVVEEKDA